MKPCLKWIDDVGSILCARESGHEKRDQRGCCGHLEDTSSAGKTNSGKLRRRCNQCGDAFLVQDHMSQQYLSELELLYEASLIAHSDVNDYEYDLDTGRISVREGVNPDATRAISSVTLRKRYDRQTGALTEAELKITLWSKTETIALAGRRFNAFPTKWQIEDADGVLARLAGVDKKELP